MKFDGYRALCRIERGAARLYTRAGHDWTRKWRGLADVLAELPVDEAWVDGEVVAVDEHGQVSFQALQNMMRQGKEAQLAYYLFDLMHMNGYDLSAVPLIERKRLLQQLLHGMPENGPLLYSDHIEGSAQQVFEHACMHGMEGIVVKRADATYQPDRGRAWLKVKCRQRQEFVIAGYTDPGGTRVQFGALLLGVYDDQRRLRYCGKVGTGFDAAALSAVAKHFTKLQQPAPAFHHPPTGSEARGVHWLKPELVAEVDFAHWTDAGIIRHAAFVGLRSDKPATDIVREQPLSDKELAMTERKAKKVAPAEQAAPQKKAVHGSGAGRDRVCGVTISHPTKILFPRIGLTKLALAEYYEAIGERILPHLQQRPLVLVRCPQGSGHKCFFQKHINETMPDAIEQIEVPEGDGTASYMLANSLPAVIGLVQMGVLELHTWGSSAGHLDYPDRMIFDLDPADGLPWSRTIEAATLVHGLLDEIGLKSFLKTTGGKGLHIVVPLKPGRPWDEVKAFSKAIAEHLAQTLPERFTANMSKAKRDGKVFVDYLRNGMGATAVAAYSTRAKPEAPVSTPIFWEELGEHLRADTFNVGNIRQRLASLSEDPWQDYSRLKQRITTNMFNQFSASAD